MLKIRLSQTGRKNAHTYRIVVKENRSNRDGDFIDLIGYYNPLAADKILKIDEDKLKGWLAKGAQLSDGVAKILPKKPVAKPKAVEPKAKAEVSKPKTTAKTTKTKK